MKQGIIKREQRLEDIGGFGKTVKFALGECFENDWGKKTGKFQNGWENKSWQ